MNIFEAIFFILAMVFCLFNIWLFRKVRGIKVYKERQLEQQTKLKEQNRHLQEQKQQKQKTLQNIRVDYDTYTNLIKEKKQQIGYLHASYIQQQNEMKDNLQKYYSDQKIRLDKKLTQYKQITQQAANTYIDSLQKNYDHAEAVHVTKMTKLKAEQSQAAADLQALKDTRKAAYDAILKQKEIKQNKNNYRLLPSSVDMQDISALERIKIGLHKPRILSMLIWQTYWQPLAKQKFPVILQDKTKVGIYKITNIDTDQSYIGQSLDVYTRWCSHCKAGLGIDTPVGNKLYKSMQEYGLQNFTFELLCECPKEQLNEKEKYFIELYQADVYGFNGNIGINK